MNQYLLSPKAPKLPMDVTRYGAFQVGGCCSRVSASGFKGLASKVQVFRV